MFSSGNRSQKRSMNGVGEPVPLKSMGSPRLTRHQSHIVQHNHKESPRGHRKRLSEDTTASIQRGDELFEARRYGDAAEQYDFYVTANAHKEDVQRLVAKALLNLGRCQVRLQKFRQAVENIAKSIRIAKGVGDMTMVAWAYCDFGLALEKDGQLECAMRAYKRAYAQSKEIRDRELECKAVSRIGGVLEATGRHMDAKRLYEKSIQHKNLTRADTKMNVEMARCLGRLLFNLERFAEAHEAYEDMRVSAKKLDEQISHGYAELGIAQCCVAIGMRDEAIASLRRALAMFKKAEYERGVVSASRRLAVALSAAGHDQEAFELYNFVIDFRKNDIPMFSASEVMSLAQTMENLGRLDDALRLYREAIKLLRLEQDQEQVAEQLEHANNSAERLEISLRFSDGDLFDLCAYELEGNRVFDDYDDLSPRGRSRSRSNAMRTGPALFTRLRRFFSDGKSPPNSRAGSKQSSPKVANARLTSGQSRDDIAILPKPRRRRTISA